MLGTVMAPCNEVCPSALKCQGLSACIGIVMTVCIEVCSSALKRQDLSACIGIGMALCNGVCLSAFKLQDLPACKSRSMDPVSLPHEQSDKTHQLLSVQTSSVSCGR